MEEALELKAEMEERKIKPDVTLYTILINVCVKEGLLEEALAFKQEMESKGLYPNVMTYSTLMNVCVKKSALATAVLLKKEMELRNGTQRNQAEREDLQHHD